MISLTSAKQLKAAGLTWRPTLHDFFAIPDRGMDKTVFVISDVLVTMGVLNGIRVVSFQGASEWALDYLVLSEVVWLPSEEQLRQILEIALLEAGKPGLRLVASMIGCRCEISLADQDLSFQAKQASEAYAAALLFILTSQAHAEP